MRLAAALLATGLAVAVLVQVFWRPSIRMDGFGYYAPVASVVFDGDLDLANEFAHADRHMRQTYFTQSDGRPANPFAVGTAVLWAPCVWLARQGDPARASHRDPERWKNASPAFQPRYVRAVAGATGVLALLAVGFLWLVLQQRTSPRAATFGAISAALGTPFVYYALAEPSYAHAASFLASTLFLGAILWRAPWPLQGAAWGLCALVRWQDAVLGLLLLPRLASELRRREAHILWRVVGCVIAALAVFAPQMLLWRRLYGSFLLVPMGGGFLDWAHARVLHLLFSTWHGAFVWSPVLALGIVGLAYERDRGLRAASWGAIALAIYVSASVSDWWGSAGFGARRLVAMAPLCGYGVALAVHQGRFRRQWAIAAAVATLWNLRLAHYDVRGWIPNNPGNVMEYQRDHPGGDARTELYGFWDHARLLHEFADAERRLWRR